MIFCGLALYSIAIQSTAFHYDDSVSIVNNGAIRSLDIPRIFNSFNTRFLVGLSFALNYKWCGLHAAGYRLINLFIHCLNAFLVFLLIKFTLNLYPMRMKKYAIEWPAFFGAMLFLCHPIQTEPVNFTTQRFVLMGSFFYLSSLILYVKSRLPQKGSFYICSLATAVAAMFCKEFVVTLPVMLTLYEFYFLNSTKGTVLERCGRLFPFFIIVLIVPILLLRTPTHALDVANIASSDSIHHVDITRARSAVGRQQYALTELNVMCTYVRLLFLPINQNYDYDYPLSSSTGKHLLSGLFLLCLLAVAAVTYRSYRMISFGILWFFIALSVESSFIPIGHVIAEYRLYLASVGFSFLVMSLILLVHWDRLKINMVVVLILIGFSILTYQRNKLWGNENLLLNDTIRKSPHHAVQYLSRGWLYYIQGKIPQAFTDYNKAIQLNPYYAMAFLDRGLAYYNQGRLSQAFVDYNKAIENDPHLAWAYYNRALVYNSQGKMSQAILDLNKAIEIDPNYADAYNNRALEYNNQGKASQAIADFNKAIDIDPRFAWAYFNRGIVYSNQGKMFQAIADYNKAIEMDPGLAEAYLNRGLIYNNQGNLPQAIFDYSKAIEIDPGLAMAYNNRGLAYDTQGKLSRAISDYNKAIDINPNFAMAYNNRGFAYFNQGNLSQAIFDYNQAIEADPHFAMAYNNLGWVYYNQGNFVQAIFNYSQAINIDLNFARAYYNRAGAYYQLGKFDEAWADVHKAQGSGASVNDDFINLLKKASGKNK